MRVEVILNEGSGALEKAPVVDRVTAFFVGRGWDVRVTRVKSGAELSAAAARAASGEAEMVVAGGGDGTIAAVAAQLTGTNRPLGILPLGTFNYFARRLGIPLELDAALEVVATGRRSAALVGEINGRVFLNNASIGLYPTVLQQREKTYGALGRSQAVAYASVALAMLQPPALLNLQLEFDGLKRTRQTPLLFVGLSGQQFESFGIPAGDCVRDGQLAACVIRPLPLAGLWRLALRAFFRGLHGASELEVACAREIRVTLRRRRVTVALDGELATIDAPLHLRARPDALVVLAGPDA